MREKPELVIVGIACCYPLLRLRLVLYDDVVCFCGVVNRLQSAAPDMHACLVGLRQRRAQAIHDPVCARRREALRKCLRDLTCNPFRRRSLCDVDPHQLSAVYANDDECIEGIETDRRDDENSMAAMSGAQLRRKVGHPWSGGPRRLTMYLATLDCATSNPSLSSSPWMGGAPQRGVSMLICRINARSSASICGRPPEGPDFKRQ